MRAAASSLPPCRAARPRPTSACRSPATDAGLNSAGAYSNTPEGKVVMAAYVDAFNKLVPQMQARVPPPRVASAKKKR